MLHGYLFAPRKKLQRAKMKALGIAQLMDLDIEPILRTTQAGERRRVDRLGAEKALLPL